MGEKIALGFHTCIDYELTWDDVIIKDLIKKYNIYDGEITTDLLIDSERTLIIAILGHMKQNIGGEMIPSDSKIIEDFAERFQYNITVGGTATRAALSIQKLGYSSAIQICCFNEHIQRLLPKEVHYYSSVGEGQKTVYPHVVLQYPANLHICINDIDFTTSRPNRIMFSRDIDSLNIQISEDFAPYIKNAEVFLISCFSEVLDFEILKDRMVKTQNLLKHLPQNALVVMEDGCYVQKEYRYYVHQTLQPIIDILSMNEDELQDYVGHRIDILNPSEVAEAIKNVYTRTNIPIILVHSAAWALAYGKSPGFLHNALEGGIAMASTRYRLGDNFGLKEYEETKLLPNHKSSIDFCESIHNILNDNIYCIPCKDLDFVKNPTTVGLGDFFAGGLLPELVLERRN